MKKLLKENPLSTKSFMYSHFIQIFVQAPEYTKTYFFKSLSSVFARDSWQK